MDLRELKRREVYGRDIKAQATFWVTIDTAAMRLKHWTMITECILDVIRIHESVDTGYPFVVGMSGYTRKHAFDFLYRLDTHITESRNHGNSDYVIEWWYRNPSDSGEGDLIFSIAPPGIYELSR